MSKREYGGDETPAGCDGVVGRNGAIGDDDNALYDWSLRRFAADSVGLFPMDAATVAVVGDVMDDTPDTPLAAFFGLDRAAAAAVVVLVLLLLVVVVAVG